MLDEAGAAWSRTAPGSRMTSLQRSANEPPWQLDRLGESGFVMITLNRGAADVYGGRAFTSVCGTSRQLARCSDMYGMWGKTGSNRTTVKMALMTRFGVRQESWQRIGGESPPWGKD